MNSQPSIENFIAAQRFVNTSGRATQLILGGFNDIYFDDPRVEEVTAEYDWTMFPATTIISTIQQYARGELALQTAAVYFNDLAGVYRTSEAATWSLGTEGAIADLGVYVSGVPVSSTMGLLSRLNKLLNREEENRIRAAQEEFSNVAALVDVEED